MHVDVILCSGKSSAAAGCCAALFVAVVGGDLSAAAAPLCPPLAVMFLCFLASRASRASRFLAFGFGVHTPTTAPISNMGAPVCNADARDSLDDVGADPASNEESPGNDDDDALAAVGAQADNDVPGDLAAPKIGQPSASSCTLRTVGVCGATDNSPSASLIPSNFGKPLSLYASVEAGE